MGDNVLYMRSSSPFGGESLPYSDQVIDDLRAFIALNEGIIQKSIASLAEAPVFLGKVELVELLKAALPDSDAPLMSRVVRWLYRGQKDGPGFEAISRHLEAFERGDDSLEPMFSKEDLRVFRDRAECIAKCWGALDRQRKAEELSKATGQRLQSLQLICDLRPIFDSNRKHIDGFLPVTTMHLTVEGADGLPNGLDVVLSESDVDMLVEHLAFAKSKLVAIRSLALKLNTPIPVTDITRPAKDLQHGN